MYMKNFKYRNFIGLLQTCGYHNCGGKTGLNMRAMFATS